MLAILSIILFYTWSFVYIFNLYKEDYVYEGIGETDDKYNYRAVTR